jgi:hypothetical protein
MNIIKDQLEEIFKAKGARFLVPANGGMWASMPNLRAKDGIGSANYNV